MIWLLLVKALAIAFAALDSLRARFWVGVAAIGVTLYLLAAFAVELSQPDLHLPLGESLEAQWWLLFVITPVLSLSAMTIAFRMREGVPAHEPRHLHLDRAAMSFLANGLLDLAVLVLGVAGTFLMGSSDF